MAVLWTETDPWGDPIALTDERWQHILGEHADMVDHLEDLRTTVREPHIVYESLADPDEHYFYRLTRTQHGRLYLVAVVLRTARPFIVTAYLTNRLGKGGKLIWLKR